MPKPSDTTIDVWINLSRAHQYILSNIEKSLKTAGLPPLAWYDVLLELNRVGKKGVRPFELQKKLLLPQYHLSRLLGRMEKAGMLEQITCAQDGRGQQVIMSRAGRAMQKRMWAVYGAQLNQAIGDELKGDELASLSALLQKLR